MTRYCLWGGRRGCTQLKLAPRGLAITVRYALPAPAPELAKQIDWAARTRPPH